MTNFYRNHSEITNHDAIIDSRDVIARIEELEGELEAAYEEAQAAKPDEVISKEEFLKSEAFDDAELTVLQALQTEAEGYAPDWKYGAQLIRSTYFAEAMEELCQDIGDLPKDLPSYLVIDWEATAENLKVDYTSVDFDGVEYYVR